MADFLNTIIPNVMTKPDELWESFGQTVYMVIVSGALKLMMCGKKRRIMERYLWVLCVLPIL